MRSRRLCATVALACLAAGTAGCLNVQQPDLFLLTRTGSGQTLTLLVNDGGTIRCNGGAAKPLPDKLLLVARDLAAALGNDAKRKLALRAARGSVDRYTVKLQNGTISFPDTAANAHRELAQTELFALQAARGPCGLGG